MHHLSGKQLRALRKLFKLQKSPFIFESERGGNLTEASIRMLLKRLGKHCRLGWASPHALRHDCGYALINKGVDVRQVQVWLGHQNIQNTLMYTELAPNSTKTIWD